MKKEEPAKSKSRLSKSTTKEKPKTAIETVKSADVVGETKK